MKQAQRTVELGLEYDTMPIQASDTSLGTGCMGPLAFLGYLEMIAGLSAEEYSPFEQTARCIRLLSEQPELCSAYRTSFENTPVDTAQEIIRRIDYLYLNGWTGTYTGSRVTLQNLAAIDAALGDTHTTGKRLFALAQALQKSNLTCGTAAAFPFLTVHLAEQKKYWSAAWQRVFAQLQVTDAEPAAESLPVVAADVKKRIVSFDSPAAAAEFTALKLAQRSDTTVFIAEHADSVLRESLGVADVPLCSAHDDGYDETMQIISASLAVRFGVPPFEEIFSFLSLPHCPLDDPKADGPRLSRMLRIYLNRTGGFCRAPDEHAHDETAAHWYDDRYAAALAKWLPVSSYDTRPDSDSAGIPRAAIHEALEDIRNYLASLPGTPAVKEARAVCINTCGRAFDLLGARYEILPVDFFRTFIASFTEPGNGKVQEAEAGAAAVYTSAGQLLRRNSVEHLVWYLPQPYVPAKLLFFPEDKECSLSFPEDGRRVFSEVCGLLSKVTKSVTLITVRGALETSYAEMLMDDAEEVNGEQLLLCGEMPAAVPVCWHPLPAPQPEWHLAAGVSVAENNGAVRTFSPTQAEMLLERPQQWLLERKARIEHAGDYGPGSFAAQRGTAAHAVVESVIKELGMKIFTMTREEFNSWFDKKIEPAIFTTLYIMNNPERKTEKMNYRNTVCDSVWRLFQMMKENGAASLYSEVAKAGTIGGVTFGGRVDVLMDTADGLRIVDMKYSGSSKYRKKLEGGSDIQLACYEKLAGADGAQNGTADPRFRCGYWLFPRKKLYTAEPSVFTGPLVQVCKTPERTHGELIESFADAISERTAQLASGTIPVITERIDAKLRVPSANDLLADITKYPSDLYDNEKHLYGYSEEE